jgi:hypothetical protein
MIPQLEKARSVLFLMEGIIYRYGEKGEIMSTPTKSRENKRAKLVELLKCLSPDEIEELILILESMLAPV